jgi:hypothetical protein
VNCAPPLSSHNQFAILSVDNIPEIDEPVADPQVVQILEKPSEVSVPRRAWRPRWERRLPAREYHGFLNPHGLRVRVHPGAGAGWQIKTLEKPAPVAWVGRVGRV